MKRYQLAAMAAVMLAATLAAETSHGFEWRLRRAWSQYNEEQVAASPWHGRYAHSAWGGPVALVVPPRAALQTNYGWGVGNTRVSRINHQFDRPWPGAYSGGQGFRPTPQWPHDTTQFGVYHVRAPW